MAATTELDEIDRDMLRILQEAPTPSTVTLVPDAWTNLQRAGHVHVELDGLGSATQAATYRVTLVMRRKKRTESSP